LKYKLSDVTVTSVQHGDGPEGAPTEQFSLNFSKVEVSYSSVTSAGKVGAPVTFGFDLKSNLKI
jgi:type VI protein secretion system component Hcp